MQTALGGENPHAGCFELGFADKPRFKPLLRGPQLRLGKRELRLLQLNAAHSLLLTTKIAFDFDPDAPNRCFEEGFESL